MKYLEMSDLQCEALPEAITDVWSLQARYLKSSNLLELPESIGKLKKLRTLKLSSFSQLKTLPDSIGDCQMLSTLDLNHCRAFEDLPNSIGRNKSLSVLRLVSTRIRRLPSGITTLENLEYLRIKQSYKLVGLPEGIGNLTNLKELDLDD
jgi:Leucine-rich repeat (LRR) protein